MGDVATGQVDRISPYTNLFWMAVVTAATRLSTPSFIKILLI